MDKKVYSLKLTKQQENKLYEAFQKDAAVAPSYAKWQLRPYNAVITCYESGKTVFQGKDAYIYASAYIKIKEENPTTNNTFPQAGSDEVGTGDYFGPVCVCATILTKKNVSLLSQYKIQDSKQLSDTEILQIAPILMKEITYSLLVVDNEKYNEIHHQHNLNCIKAKLHNQAYKNLKRKKTLPKLIVIDQFAEDKTYYRYLNDEDEIIRNITFQTKAENDYLSVACASIIARYAFLKKMEALNLQYKMNFPKGSGRQVDEFAKEFVKQYGFDELSKVAKLHFKNTEKMRKL